MFKFFGGLVVGVFVGALAVEIVERVSPNLIARVRDKAKDLGSRVRSSTVYVDNVLHRHEAPRAGQVY